ncbi:MAG: phosphoenolpyruvate--protein phosphotransferase [Ruminobacter sp.]|uniref:Phosphoenolpyruvate-protein phosphotransferase n=1 Tax=Ruminobacter amylophilus TaxID=867 RepID=A0A662ZE45_9GAMM|nr:MULTISPECIES: phosphoenolpyruvate--protein phosphotransferase [Ruminobacter]MBQ3776413.1 phosphoenolpyruvate--protein phosphotransferase [Ruminobacter sp.]SFP00453.1 phosphotransferase system, enzyme I, PtsI [Ruminobacter amylophilus]
MQEGFVITEGVACAPAVIFKNDPPMVNIVHIAPEDVEKEIELYHTTLERTHRLFLDEKNNVQSVMAKEFLDVAILYLTDNYVKKLIEDRIRNELCNAESAVMRCYHDYINELISLNDPFVMHNEFEIHNLAETLILELRKKKVVLPEISEDSILVCNNITPAQFLTMNTSHIKGILLEDGNTQSHLAIVLRSTKIPAIFNVSNATKLIAPGTNVLVDAYANRVYLDPLDELIWQANKNAQKYHKTDSSRVDVIKPLMAQYKTSSDGERMRILANINSVSEINKLTCLPSSGIGLFRTEFLFMNCSQEPDEEQQYLVYKKIMDMLPSNYEITFRTFDFNADKLPLYMSMSSAFNVDTNQHHRNTLVKQLRAILRASAQRQIRIMFPMVAGYEETMELIDLFNTVKQNLTAQGYDTGRIKTGIMIETPAGALMSDALAPLVDFFSIGTNDLTQYTEACSREAATHRNDELTPAVLKLIYLTVQNARKHRIPVCICGELVHNLNYLALFISIGLRDFSVAPFYLNKLLEKIHELEVRIDLNLATKINAVRTKQEIIELNKSLIAQNFGHSGMID